MMKRLLLLASTLLLGCAVRAANPFIPYIPSTNTYQGAASVINIASGTIRNFTATTITSTNAVTISSEIIWTDGYSQSKKVVVNAKDPSYGAVGNGSIDDTTAIQAALNAVGAGTVLLPAGTYYLSAPLVISGQTLKGESRLSTFLKRGSGTAAMVQVPGGGNISNLTLDGNNLGGVGLAPSNTALKIFDNLGFKNFTVTSYAVWITSNTEYATFNDFEFRNCTYGKIFISTADYNVFNRMRMFGTDSQDGIHLDVAVTTTKFNDTYMESSVNMSTIGIRDIWFNGVRVRLDAMVKPWWSSSYITASENAQIDVRNVSILKNVNTTAIPVFKLSSYQMTLNDIHVFDSVSASGWSVITDSGTNNLTLRNLTVESQNPWLLFSTDSIGGFDTYAENVNYTQGVTGQAVWGNPNILPDQSSNHITVINSNLNQSISTSTNKAGGFTFQHIKGNLDLTQSTGTNQVFDVSIGSITDPNNTIIGTVISSANVTTSSCGANGALYDLAALNIPAGTWLLWGNVAYNANGASFASVNLRLGVGGTTAGNSSAGLIQGQNYLLDTAGTPTTFSDWPISVSPFKVTPTITTRYYLKGLCSDYSVAIPRGTGILNAMRVNGP